MRTCSGAISILLAGLGIWMLPERATVLDLPMTMRISSVVLPLLIVLAGVIFLTWSALTEKNL